MTMTDTPDLAARMAAIDWYHTIDLAPGLTTPGHFDTRPSASIVPLPARLDGLRCLDVGTWDGFWAFEMERRGAASVTAIDIEDPRRWDWPSQAFAGPAGKERIAFLDTFKNEGAGFALAKEAFGSSVDRVDRSVYELDPGADGVFDLAFIGSLLLHLRDPVRALDSIRGVLKPGGTLVMAETIELIPTLLRPKTAVARLEGLEQSWWWQPNAEGIRQMARSAGFEIEETTGTYFIPLGASHPKTDWRKMLPRLRHAEGREKAIIALKGLPHTALRARRIV